MTLILFLLSKEEGTHLNVSQLWGGKHKMRGWLLLDLLGKYYFFLKKKGNDVSRENKIKKKTVQ